MIAYCINSMRFHVSHLVRIVDLLDNIGNYARDYIPESFHRHIHTLPQHRHPAKWQYKFLEHIRKYHLFLNTNSWSV